MPFSVTIKQAGNQNIVISIDVGAQLFVLGANGTGKSSLMLDIYRANQGGAVRISAHRQSWFSSADSLSPQEMRGLAQNMASWDSNHTARWNEIGSNERPRMAVTLLVDAENVRARKIMAAADADCIEEVKTLAKTPSALRDLNELLHLSNLPIRIIIKAGEQVVVSKSGGPEYNVAELSDGERNALLVAAMVLTAPPGKLILIDEPERHLHRSIISPMLTGLFGKRPDCALIVSTHEIMLPIDHPDSQVLLIRGCSYAEQTVSAYEVALIPAAANFDDEIKKDILGARHRILFTEGNGRSLDKPLYSQLFPNVSVIAKSNCRDVEHAVRGIRDADELHWVKAFGIIDGDGRQQAELDELKSKGIYAVAAYSVESIYYHVEVQRMVAERLAKSVGGNAAQRLAEAKVAALSAISQNTQRLSERIAEKEIRGQVLNRLPSRQHIAAGAPINFTIAPGSTVSAEKTRLEQLIANADLASIINRYPVRESNALGEIAQRLGFQNRRQYESAVLTLLQDDDESLLFVRSLFGALANDINAA
jgi:ABC-type cobalamin/Fe3+-siderophores transport system ATPase subunit